MKKSRIVSVFIVATMLLTACSRSNSAKTDVFGLGAIAANSDAEEYYNYFANADSIPADYSEGLFEPQNDFKFVSEEEQEDSSGKIGNVKRYDCGIGTLPSVKAVGYSKVLAARFALQSLDRRYADKFFEKYPVYYSAESYSAIVNSLFEKQTIEEQLYLKDGSEYYVKGEKTADIVLDDSGIDTEPKNGTERKIIAKDALVFFVNSDCAIDNLTLSQIRDIYSGRIKDFGEISKKTDGKISVFTRGESTYNLRYFNDKVMNGEKATAAKTVGVFNRNSAESNNYYSFEGEEYRKYAAEYDNSKNAIGYAYRSLVNKYYKDSVKIISIDGVKPTDENIKNGKYPLSIDVTATVKSGNDGKTGQRVLDWFYSEKGQSALNECGVVSIERS